MPFQLLHQLPEELRQDILERLSPVHLIRLNLASSWAYQIATPLLYKAVELVDGNRSHGEDGDDEHDDTPIIEKLILFATKPWIASCVQVLTHRCHLPPPAIFTELPRMTFSAQTLSTDPRTIKLVQLAVKNMKNVNTIRIILGHPTLTDAILRCFFDSSRATDPSYARIRKLWLENCRVSAGLTMALDHHPYDLPLTLSFPSLESVRFRRLPMRPGSSFNSHLSGYHFNYARGPRLFTMQDGLGGSYRTTINDFNEEFRVGESYIMWLEGHRDTPEEKSPTVDLYEKAHLYDDRIYEMLAGRRISIPEEVASLGTASKLDRSIQAYRGTWLDPSRLASTPADTTWKRMQREKIPSADAAIMMLQNTSQSLTSLNLDWVMHVPTLLGSQRDPDSFSNWCGMFLSLFSCRFPHLRSFQLRNCVMPDTVLPTGLYLLDVSTPVLPDTIAPAHPLGYVHSSGGAAALSLRVAGLEFMEAHQGIQCLAWPMDHFFAPRQLSYEIAARVGAVIDNLGRTLIDLRVDTLYSPNGESQSEETDSDDYVARASRRRFITHFASRMTKVESIKIEGGMPRDERREIVRALHASPLKKIVMIGMCSPIGNTWGEDGRDMGETFLSDNDASGLEGEDKTAVFALGTQKPQPPPSDQRFEGHYGWQGAPPMLHTIACYHADTVREVKMCGYKGSPSLFSPTPIATPLLASLKHFHNLESIIMSMTLSTLFEGSSRDSEVISYWCDARDPRSTSLVLISDEEPEGWELELKTKYAPDALAWRITNFVGPFLSETAKQKPGGVHVRASFCVGNYGGIFDCDLQVGKGAVNSNVCLGFKGPREELEVDRRRSKLENRRWF